MRLLIFWLTQRVNSYVYLNYWSAANAGAIFLRGAGELASRQQTTWLCLEASRKTWMSAVTAHTLQRVSHRATQQNKENFEFSQPIKRIQ